MAKLRIMRRPHARHVYVLQGSRVPLYRAEHQVIAVSLRDADARVIDVSPNRVDEQPVVISTSTEAQQKTEAARREAAQQENDRQVGVKQEANKPDTLLVKEMDETNNWARLGAQLYFGWFTLMLTINGVAVGWLFNNRGTVPPFARMMFLIFFVLNLMGTITTILIRKHMLECDQRIQDVLRGIIRDRASEASYFAPQSPVPRQAVNTVFAFTAATLFLLLFFWMVLGLWPEALLV